MDFIKKAADSFNNNDGNQGGQQQGGGEGHAPQQQQQQEGGGSFFDNLKNKANNAAGGGRESEKDEDYLDKGVDFVQEKFLGQGPQDNESALEQAKDEQISDFIRDKYKGVSGGKDFPIADKPKSYER